MNRSFAKRLRTRPIGAVAASAGLAALPLVLPMVPALTVAGMALLAAAAFGCRDAATLRRLRRDLVARGRSDALLGGPGEPRAPLRTTAGDRRRMRRVDEALAGGFPTSAAEEATALASTTRIPATERLAVLRRVARWQREHESRPPAGRRSTFDIVYVSHLGLPGGNTSATAAEVRICRDKGLTIGLLHHPIYRWGPNPPLHPRVEELVDGDAVSLIGLDDTVECDLAVVRPPTVLMRPLERRPAITAGNTVVVANQTPFKFYGPDGPREPVWDIAAVDRHITDWLGRHTWYAGGPTVRSTLLEHHADAVAGLDLDSSPWNEAIEVAQWRLSRRRAPDGRVRIGRHSRDDALKWPEDPDTLRGCYPDSDPFEVHVLGGAETPTRILGRLPGNWTVHGFNAMPAKEFLAQIDVMVYFIASDGLEAFGRAPLEAMAAGVPVIMDRRFEPTFGPAAVYCEPGEVASVAEHLVTDPDAYASQRSTAWGHLAVHFSGWALLKRLAHCAGGPRLHERLDRFRPEEYWERRYRQGKDSGEGSRGSEGAYKARYVSDLIKEREVGSVVDWGCGDGQVLEKIDLHGASYTGLDVSAAIVERLRERFSGRSEYRFGLPGDFDPKIRCDLALSLDVLFHLPGDADYRDYLSNLFGGADRLVLVYSTDHPGGRTAGHVRRRQFTADVAEWFPEWTLVRDEPPLTEGLASFFLYERARRVDGAGPVA